MFFYSDYGDQWCYGINLEDDQATNLCMTLKLNGLGMPPFDILSGKSTDNINSHNDKNFNFLITCYDKGMLENLVKYIKNDIDRFL